MSSIIYQRFVPVLSAENQYCIYDAQAKTYLGKDLMTYNDACSLCNRMNKYDQPFDVLGLISIIEQLKAIQEGRSVHTDLYEFARWSLEQLEVK